MSEPQFHPCARSIGQEGTGFVIIYEHVYVDGWCTRCEEPKPYEFIEKPAAKSSTSVCLATVCPKCGHKFDGKIGGAGEPCNCPCHRGRV